MKNLKKLLDEYEGISGYKITDKHVLSYELFFVHRALETVRDTDTTYTDVTVYVDHDGTKGDSTFHVYRSMTDDDIKEKINKAAARAALVSNQPYELPDKGELDEKLPTNIRTAVYTCPQNQFPTGAVMPVDGGLTAIG